MKRILFLFGLLLVSVLGMAQAPSNYTNINGRYRWIAGMFDSTFHIPKGTTPSLRTGGSTNAGGLFYNTADSSVYTYTGTQWIKLRGVVIDTTSLSNRINLKLNISDTSSMLTNYFRINGVGLNRAGQTVLADTLLLSTRAWRQKGIDSVTSLITSGYVPYTGATTNVDLGTHTLTAYNLIINHASGSGVAASITKGGNGEALTISKTSGSGNAMSVSGGLTSLVDLSLSSISNATTDTDRFLVSDGGVVKYRTGTELLSDIGGASASSISGTTNYIPKFTSSSAIGNSVIYESSGNVGINTTSNSYTAANRGNLNIAGSSGAILGFQIGGNARGYVFHNNTDLSLWNEVNGGLIFGTNAAEGMRLTSTGLGIGTSSPAYKLDVAGVGRFSATEDQVDITGGSGNSKRANTIYRGTNASGTSKVGYIGVNVFSSDGTFDIAASDNIKLLTGGVQRMLLDASGNLGLGVTPSAWGSPLKAFQVVNAGMYGTTGDLSQASITGNAYYDGSVFRYISTAAAQRYTQTVGQHQWYTATSGTAGNAISFTQAMTLDASGNLGIGTTSPNYQLTVGTPGTTTDAFIQLGSATTGTGNIYFGDATGTGTASYAGFIRYSHSADQMLFGTSSANAMAINSLGSVGIGTTSVDASAIVQITSTTKGFLPPVMTGAQAEAISATPAAGLLVYANNGNGTVITSIGWWGYNGTTWVKLN